MAWFRRKTQFRRQRPRRLRRARRLTRTRFRRSRFRRRGGTASSIVKLSIEVSYTPWQSALSGIAAGWRPFTFTCANVPGFTDYVAVYSQFRIKKCVLKINRGPNTNLAYLVVPSRNYSLNSALIQDGATQNAWIRLVPPKTEEVLRQSRYQKEIMPSTTSGKVRVGFHPYTLIGGAGPSVTTADYEYFRIWNLNKWTPISWAGAVGGAGVAVQMYGPYIVLNDALTNQNPPTDTGLNTVLEMYCQFKGQV